MTPEAEKQVLESLYDRIFDAVTYVPGGGRAGGMDKQHTYFQMLQNAVLNPNDFTNPLSPLNPTKGDAKAAKAFSDMVDVVPVTGPSWADSGKKVSGVL